VELVGNAEGVADEETVEPTEDAIRAIGHIGMSWPSS
jgi:hypothetical protein